MKELDEAFEQDDKARQGMKKGYGYYPLGHDCDRQSWEKVREAYRKK
jgi:hypothetical protein